MLSCFTRVWLFCDPMDCSPPGSSVHGTLQARILEWVAMPSSKGIFSTQGSSPHLLCLLHCRWILCHWATGEAPLEGGALDDQVMTVECSWVGSVPRGLSRLLPCESTARWLPASQGSSSHRTPSLWVPGTWTYQPPELWEINVHSFRPQSIVLLL